MKTGRKHNFIFYFLKSSFEFLFGKLSFYIRVDNQLRRSANIDPRYRKACASAPLWHWLTEEQQSVFCRGRFKLWGCTLKKTSGLSSLTGPSTEGIKSRCFFLNVSMSGQRNVITLLQNQRDVCMCVCVCLVRVQGQFVPAAQIKRETGSSSLYLTLESARSH